MRVFVTGASGWIGSAVVPELLGAGHTVVGLARSDASAEAIEAAGAEVRRGGLEDLDSLRAGAADADGVIQLAYIHDFSRMEDAARADLAAIQAMGAELEGTGKPFVIASGVVGLAVGRTATEEDQPAAGVHPRMAGVQAALALRDVRTSIVRLPPTVHGDGDHGFMAVLVGIARDTGVSGYIGDGSNRWPAVHVKDAASAFRLALEQAPAGTALHPIDDEGVPIREVAEVIGRHLELPVEARPAEHFGWLGRFLALDAPVSSALTRERFGWAPTQPGLLEDLEQGHYFR